MTARKLGKISKLKLTAGGTKKFKKSLLVKQFAEDKKVNEGLKKKIQAKYLAIREN